MICINEVYFGKSKELLDIEQKLDTYRKKYYGVKVPVRCNSDKDLQEVNRGFEKYFGIGTFALSITIADIYNAYTIPISYRYDVSRKKDSLIIDQGHYKFNPKYDYSCIVVVYSKLMFDPSVTTDQIMAIILHEIGHNFYFCIYGKPSGALSKLYSVSNFLKTSIQKVASGIKTNKSDEEISSTVSGDLNDNEESRNRFMEFLIYLSYYHGKISTLFNKALNILTLGLLSRMDMSLAAWINKTFGMDRSKYLKGRYNDERTADNFATIHGYGSSLIPGLRYLDKSYEYEVKNMSKIPIVGKITAINNAASMLLCIPFEEHPGLIERAADQLAMLENEISKTDLDPKMKKALEADISACKANMEQARKEIEAFNKDPKLANKYRKIMLKQMEAYAKKNKNLDVKDRFDKLDANYDALKNK